LNTTGFYIVVRNCQLIYNNTFTTRQNIKLPH